MNDNKLGGPGYCPKCCRCVDNLSFHVTICNEMAKDREIDDLQTENYKLRMEISKLKLELSLERKNSKALLHIFDPKVIKEMEKLND